VIFALALQSSRVFAQQLHQPTATELDHLKTFLMDHLLHNNSPDNRLARYSFSFVDLNDDGKPEVIVHISARDWCGSGGCTTLVLASTNASYRIVSEISISRLPIRVLTSKTNGWHDISVWVQGGGIQPGYEAKLTFDGSGYPENPTMPPAVHLIKQPAGEVVINIPDPPIY
jgi:hypothetical protein